MVLSSLQQALVSVVLVLCVFVVMPRMFGGGGSGRSLRGSKAAPGRYDPYQQRRQGGSERILQPHLNPDSSDSKTYKSIQQMRNEMKKEVKSQKTRGNGRDLAFTLMPLYAVGVGVFAAYKFLKVSINNCIYHDYIISLKTYQ
uniref:Resistance to inhibitors of cholinesterase protein 3 N-terminal domain-containing protein n=1 Tax=Sphenodon punctatus TaxID=8508 RepID=A0A8D0L599_SPHPU